MKKLLASTLAMGLIFTTTQAQELKADAAAPQAKQLSKEDKAAMKAKQEADLAEAFRRADLTPDQEKKAREIMAEASAKNKDIKMDAKLSEDEKKAKMKEVNDAKNDKLKEAMGEPKYKAFQTARKAQKEAMKGSEAPVKE